MIGIKKNIMKNDEQILEDSIFKIGKVFSVEGRTVKIKVDKAKNTSHLLYKGEILKNISVGGYVKIVKGFTKIVGKVEGEYTNEDKEYIVKEYVNEKEKINRILIISLLGFFKADERFERGIKELPLIDNECFLLHNEEFNQVHNFLRKEDKPITIGRLSLEKGQEIKIGINSLFASHIGIFGNTGSGKSYTLAKIYRELFLKYKDNLEFKKNAEFFLIDFNGEYVDEKDNVIIEKQYKNIYKLSTRTKEGGDKYPITRETLYDPAFWAVLSEATEKTQRPFLNRALAYFGSTESGSQDLNEELREMIVSMVSAIISKKDNNLGKKIFSDLFFDLAINTTNKVKINEIVELVNQKVGFNGTTASYYVADTKSYEPTAIQQGIIEPLNTKIRELEFDNSEVAVIRLRIVTKYYDEIIKGYSNREHLAPLMKRLENRIGELKKVVAIVENISTEKNFTVISLKDVNFDIRKVLPMLLCKRLYEEKKKKNDDKTYLNIIIDEAHNVLSWNSERESEQWKDHRLETFEEIIKEGRKFGVFLTIASQRPSDISSTIVSQLHNYFLHRLINNNDILAVEKTISFLDKVSFDYLPILPTGTCILAGILAQVPVVVDIGKIEDENEPKNKTMTLVEKWENQDNANNRN